MELAQASFLQLRSQATPRVISQLWRKLWFSVSQLQDKIWEWPGNEAKSRWTYTHMFSGESLEQGQLLVL